MFNSRMNSKRMPISYSQEEVLATTASGASQVLNEYFLNEMNKQMNEWILCSLQFPVLHAQKMLTASKMAPAFAKMDFSPCLGGPLRNVKVKKKSAFILAFERDQGQPSQSQILCHVVVLALQWYNDITKWKVSGLPPHPYRSPQPLPSSHVHYNAGLVSPDIGLVFLQRKVEFSGPWTLKVSSTGDWWVFFGGGGGGGSEDSTRAESLLFITQCIGKRTISHGRCPTNKCSPKEQMNKLSHHSAFSVMWSQLSFSVSLFTTLISSGQISLISTNSKGQSKCQGQYHS